MPLIIICGFPCSGKTHCTDKLVDFFEKYKNCKTRVVSEEKLPPFHRNDAFACSSKEKEIRNRLKSEVQRYINKSEVLIINSPNYVKGYRYELYCISKSAQTPQCVIYCDIDVNKAKELNLRRSDLEKYEDDVFDGLVMRFEAPNPENRWDSPLFNVNIDEELPLEAIHDSLMLRKPPPPNNSTLPQPLAATNFLHELDVISQSVVKEIIETQKNAVPGDKLSIGPSSVKVNYLKPYRSLELQKFRRQFVMLTRSRAIFESSKIADMFVNYINRM